jgi:hypothetical protein
VNRGIIYENSMSAWRRKALEFLPSFRAEIESADTATYLWLEISSEFTQAVDAGDSDFVDGTLKYLIWSFSDEAGMDAQQAVNCGFLEDITYNKQHWKYFSKWFTPAQFVQYASSFKHALSDKEFVELENLFYGK